jgi:hypothetical protein
MEGAGTLLIPQRLRKVFVIRSGGKSFFGLANLIPAK